MSKTKYEWRNLTKDYHKKDGEEVWALGLFDKEIQQPLFNYKRKVDIAPHELEITTFDEKSYRAFLGDRSKYGGNVDARFFVRYGGGLVDSEPRAIAYFLNGEMKEASDGFSKYMENPEEFKKHLTEYFETVNQAVGKHLKDMIINSNLPQKQRDAVRSLME